MAHSKLLAAAETLIKVQNLLSGAKAPSHAPRDRSIHIRVNEHEQGRLRQQAAARGLSVSAYIMALVSSDSEKQQQV